MPVQQEIKSQLAKLLATEDIVVEHKQVETAEFNVGTRVLVLPLWEKASNDVYDMLVGHEVGHALFTPDEEWWKEYKIPPQFVNVVEDARIEKLIKRKYMGLAKSFYKAYNELSEQDFFELDGEDISTFNLADRINLHYKIGSFLDLSFTDREKEIVDLIGKTETFAEVLEASQVLYDYCKQVQDEERQAQQQVSEAKSEENENIEEIQMTSSVSDTEEGEDDSESPISQDAPVEKGKSSLDDTYDGEQTDEIELDTVSSLEEKLKDLTSKHGLDNEYLQIPEVKLDSVIVDNKEIHDLIDDHYAVEYERCAESYEKHKEHYEEVPHYSYGSYYNITKDCFEKADLEYKKFKKDSQKEVSYLVKEFECKKAAGAYSRASVSRTGVLDTTKLQNYKFSEDLFKKVTILPDGKNHGLIFILDWSGSMSTVIEDTLKQLYSLIWFCKKVQIPFEVYAFTYEWVRAKNRELSYLYDRDDREGKEFHCDRKEYEFHIDPDFNLLNFFSSKSNTKDLEHQMLNIWRTAHSFRYRCHYHYPPSMSLSGTPLNESLVSLYKIIPQFQKSNGVEKVQCIILTDGEADTLPYNKNVKRSWEDDEFLGTKRFNPSASFIRDRKLGRTYKLDYSYSSFTTALLTNMQDRFSGVNFIGIRILGPRDGRNFIYRHGNDQKAQEDWKKHKSFSLKNAGYDAYFGISSNALAQDSEFDVDDDATKAQIKRAFIKSLKVKKLNKKILGEFIELVV